MASPPNPSMVPVVTYEYLFCLLSSDRFQPPARQKARGLLSGSSTPGTVGRRSWAKILDMISSLQLQTAGEPYTLYH
jgi:hypothetical protein